MRTPEPGLIESEGVDLAKNRWIPLASTAVFLLLTAVCVSVGGSFAVRYTEPTLTPLVASATFAQPSPALPTATVMPSPTIAPSIPVPVLLRVLPGAANVRAAPNITARIIGQINKGSLVRPVARSEDGRWLLVISTEGEITGWVASELLETVGGDPKTLPTVVPITPPPLATEVAPEGSAATRGPTPTPGPTAQASD
jgi:hypothetical protein